jgi:hypothetical protein
MPHVEAHALPAQPVQPAAQQRSGFHVARKDPAGAADKGLDAQRARPAPHRLGIEGLQQRAECRMARAVACGKGLERFAVRQVQPADAGQQELPAGRRHRVEDIGRDARCGKHLGRHQARRARTDDDDGGVARGDRHGGRL